MNCEIEIPISLKGPFESFGISNFTRIWNIISAELVHGSLRLEITNNLKLDLLSFSFIV